MAQLVVMRQRIRAIETIKKITHAMRLISMSSHSRLKHKKAYLERYKDAFQDLWLKVRNKVSLNPESTEASQYRLIILISSQKGLCGTFNSSLFKYFEHEVQTITSHDHIIAVGKFAINYLKQRQIIPSETYTNFNATNFIAISQALTNFIVNSHPEYDSVAVYSNVSRSFFVQRPQKTTILPLQTFKEEATSQENTYLVEQPIEELSAIIKHMMISVTLQEVLFESLLSEQAARFVSMDSATRNADNLLQSMKLEYNKSRQSVITRELTELATSY